MSLRIRATLLIVSLLCAVPTVAATNEENRVADATDVVDQLLRIPEQSIPPALLARAYAIAVVPNVLKVGFGVGVRRGKGVLVVRRSDKSWSNPAFVTLTGGSLGWQIGAQSTDVILVFKTRKGVDDIASGKLTLGADAAVAAGPVGRQGSIATDIQFRAEVYSYSRSRGLFVGVSLEGSGITMDRKANAAFYGSSSITPEKIFESSGNLAPQAASNFVQVLTAQTQRLPMQPAMSSGVSAVKTEPAQESSVRTFGIADADNDGVYPDEY